MEGEHAQMWQIPCKMTNSSSKPLQTLGKWYQPRNPKKNPKPAQKILKLFHTLSGSILSAIFAAFHFVGISNVGSGVINVREDERGGGISSPQKEV